MALQMTRGISETSELFINVCSTEVREPDMIMIAERGRFVVEP